jgi:uncharacterized protein (TIGR02145 family)
MKNFKIGAEFVCKMAMLLAFVFAACSEDNSPMNGAHGGAAEETGVYAQCDSVACPYTYGLMGRVDKAYPKLLRVRNLGANESEGSIASQVSFKGFKGMVVTVRELDSLTLETTGRSFVDTVDNEEGQFVFNTLQLKSPFVLVETLDSNANEPLVWDWGYFEEPGKSTFQEVGVSKKPVLLRRSAIVDLRQYDKINVDYLTHEKVPLLREYYAAGMSFDEANKKAEKKVLENLGVYDDLGAFEDFENDNSELPYVRLFWTTMQRYGVTGMGIYYGGYYDSNRKIANVPFERIAALGDSALKYYQNSLKMLEYENAYIARVSNYGECTEARENEVTLFGLTCRSKKWTLKGVPIDYVPGTLVDNRDGKTYKTVTYNWGGVTQTWMAENLNYVDETSPNAKRTTCWRSDSTCELYGRFYALRAAMDLDTSFRMVTVDSLPVEDKCSSEYSSFNSRHRKPLDWNDWDSYYDFIAFESMTPASIVADSVLYDYCSQKYQMGCLVDYSKIYSSVKPVIHQGVCPDGWRLPNKEDWKTLTENVMARNSGLAYGLGSGFDFVEPMMIALTDGDFPVLTIKTEIWSEDNVLGYVSIPPVDAPFADPVEPNTMCADHSLFSFSPTYQYCLPVTRRAGDYLAFDALDEPVLVRCIKN